MKLIIQKKNFKMIKIFAKPSVVSLCSMSVIVLLLPFQIQAHVSLHLAQMMANATWWMMNLHACFHLHHIELIAQVDINAMQWVYTLNFHGIYTFYQDSTAWMPHWSSEIHITPDYCEKVGLLHGQAWSLNLPWTLSCIETAVSSIMSRTLNSFPFPRIKHT